MQNKKNGLITLALSAIFLLASCGGGESSEVSEVTNMVQSALERLDKQVEAAASSIPASELNSSQTRQVLLNLYTKESSSIDCSSIDSSGIITAVEPTEYRHTEGADISNQGHWILLSQTHQPVLSNLFKSVEGPYAVDLAWPLFDTAGNWTGSVSFLFNSTNFIGDAISAASPALQQKVMIMLTDGTILFESDTSQIGINAFTDPIFLSSPSLLELAHHMVSESSGEGTYQFTAEGSDEVVTKQAYWETASLHGTEWRVVVIEE